MYVCYETQLNFYENGNLKDGKNLALTMQLNVKYQHL